MPTSLLANHPLRARLNDELHARPPEPAHAPLALTRIVMLTGEAGLEAERAAVAELCAAHGAPGPAPHARWHAADLGVCRLRWERHTELTTYTFSLPIPEDARAFSRPAMAALSPAWVSHLPGALLVGVHAEARRGLLDAASAQAAFGPSPLAVSRAQGGAVTLASDFRLQADGFSRLLVMAEADDAALIGRVLQAGLEIETYRMAALLALPEALEARDALGALEAELAAAMERLADGAEPGEDRTLLDGLTSLSARAEALAARNSYRFAAARAYYGLVRERIESLGEAATLARPTIGAFLARRLAPAMRTCDAVGERQQALLDRIARATRLLATRVDVAVEEQNARLLASMNARARAQLRLQETVEGLSVVAISYYAVGLVGYGAKAMAAFGWKADSGMIAGVATPFVILLVWLGLKRVKARLGAGAHSADD